MKILKASTLLLVCFALASYSYAQDTVKTSQDILKEISTIGIFDGKIITVGNFERKKVYKINEFCISLTDLSEGLIDSLKGKKIMVTGKLKTVESKHIPTKTNVDGKIYEPYKETDKIFISEPTFAIVYENREPLIEE